MNLITNVSYIYIQAFAICFCLSVLIAITYIFTFRGFSYSRPFVQAIILGSLVTAMAMISIEDNLARGIGMMGALTMIRFRSSVKDPKDMIFIFASIAVGIACSVQKYDIAFIGSGIFCLTAYVINTVSLGKNTYYDGILRIQSNAEKDISRQIYEALQKHTSRFALISLRELNQGSKYDFSFQIKMKNNVHQTDIIDSFKGNMDIQNVNFLMQQTNLEI